ncbi:MAG: phage baseplate assembly protein V [bacterium]
MRTINGVVVGKVKKVNDPENLGRVKVFFPWLSERNNSFWARIATFMTGGDRGSWFMPEEGDEVLVAFEHGDVQHPYVIGFLWNGRDNPPIKDNDIKIRRLKTVSGHIVEFDDRNGNEKIHIITQGEQEIELNDVPVPQIRIKTKNGHEILMTEAPPAHIKIQTAGGNFIELTDAPPSLMISTAGISISAQAGMITLNCLQASVNASALLNINAPMTVLAGLFKPPL